MNQSLNDKGMYAPQNAPPQNQSSTEVAAVTAAAISTAAAVAAMNRSINSSVPSVDLSGNLDGKYMVFPTLPNPIGDHDNDTAKFNAGVHHLGAAATTGNMNAAGSIPNNNLPSSKPSSSSGHGVNSISSTNLPNNILRNNLQSASNDQISSQGNHHTVHSNAYTHSAFTVPQTMPQHLHFNPVPTYQPFRQPTREEKPLIFQNLPLRRGKWTPEEERFAKAIIEAFEKGIIHGCENGCTLRAYLSRKLHCQPMRISKKYAGKSIGKQVFMSRLNVSPGREVAASNHEALKKLEFHFHMSVLQEGIANNLDGAATGSDHLSSRASSGSHLPGSFQSTNSAQLPIAASQQPSVVNTNANKNSIWPQYNIPQSSVVPSQPVLPPTLLPQTVNNGTMMPMTTSNIHQNLFNAFKQAQTLYASRENAPKEGNIGTTVINTSTRNAVDSTNANGNLSSSQSPDKLTTGQAQQNWLNETMAIIPTLDPTLNDGRYSPTYTSKSFDDLHQFIGKDCPPPPSETESKVQSSQAIGSVGPATYAAIKMEHEEKTTSVQGLTANANPSAISMNTTESNMKGLGVLLNKQADANGSRTFTHAADEYSFFAQQSAMEASKHSAYIRQDTSPTTASSVTTLVPILEPSSQVVPATFNAVNLQIYDDSAQGQSGAVSSTSKFNTPANLHRPVPIQIVSGSERSSSEFGTDVGGSSSSRSGSSASDNDNSDLASDEGRMSVNSLQRRKKRRLNKTGGKSSHNRNIAKLHNDTIHH